MSILSIFRTPRPDLATATKIIPPPAAPEPIEASAEDSGCAQHDAVMQVLDQVLQNLEVVHYNVRVLDNKLTALQADVNASINNETLLSRDHDAIIAEVKHLKQAVSSLYR
ncbi:MAG TPA: hypothetical protein VF630_10795 [Hymenobacter sp.]|jgi:hypothetical protein